MTNPNDLIPRKEVDEKTNHLIEIVEAYISASKIDNNPQWTLVYEMQKEILEGLLQELSQIESVKESE